MKKLLYFLMAVGLILSFQACSSDSDPIPSNNDDVEPAPLLLKKLTYIDLEDGGEFSIEFVCQGKKLVRIIEDDGDKTEFYYDGDLISRTVQNGNRVTEYEYDADYRLVRSYYSHSGFYEEQIITYVDDMAVVQVNYGDIYDDTSGSFMKNLWFSDGNVIKYSFYEGGESNHYEITYDDKPNILSGIIGFNKLVVSELTFGYIVRGPHNVMHIKGVDGTVSDWVYTNEYNEGGYPVHVNLNVTASDGSQFQYEFYLEYY